MRKFKLSTTSDSRLNTCHKEVQLIIRKAISISPIDFGIARGHSSQDDQFELFKKGREFNGYIWKIIDRNSVVTFKDGYEKLSDHNYFPSKAVDIYAFINGRASWDKESLTFLAGLITAVAEMLFADGIIKHKIKWGGNWDNDGELLTDQNFDDRPHLVIYKP